MNYKKNNGFTGIDISVALIVFVLFVGIIASLLYNFGVSSRAVNRKAQATEIAISKIEEMKRTPYENLQGGTQYGDANGQLLDEGATSGPYTIETTVEPYQNSKYVEDFSPEEKDALQDVIRIVTVTVKYTSGGDEETVDISTAIAKEN